MMQIPILLLFLVYFIADGKRDAIMWSKKGADAFPTNEHTVLGAMRIVLFTLVLLKVSIFTWLTALLLFPLIHNGSYYYYREQIEPGVYPKKFWAEPSETSTAVVNFSLPYRVAFALMGGFVFLTYLIV